MLTLCTGWWPPIVIIYKVIERDHNYIFTAVRSWNHPLFDRTLLVQNSQCHQRRVSGGRPVMDLDHKQPWLTSKAFILPPTSHEEATKDTEN